MLRLLKQSFEAAELNLALTQDDIKVAENQERAAALMEEANHTKEICQGISKGIDLASSLADPVEAGTKVAGMIVEMIGEVETKHLVEKANELLAEATSIKADDAYKKLVGAKKALVDLTGMKAEAAAEAKSEEDDTNDDWSQTEDSFDASSKGKFRFADAKDAVAKARALGRLAQATVHAGVQAQEAVSHLVKGREAWQADPATDTDTLARMVADAKGIITAAIYTRDKNPPVLQQAVATYNSARDAMAAAHPSLKRN